MCRISNKNIISSELGTFEKNTCRDRKLPEKGKYFIINLSKITIAMVKK